MKKISIVTTTRAEYGLLKPLIIRLRDNFEVHLIVSGSHLIEKFGATGREIEEDGISIYRKIQVDIQESSASGVSHTMADTLEKFSVYFAEDKPDALVVLGDRYEMLAVCVAAMNERVPIFHLHGGETTEGAIDECIRHAITKMSYLHFTALDEYRKRVIQLGENPERVFCVGSLGVENVLKTPLLSKHALGQSINFDLNVPYGVVTFHPVTLEDNTVLNQVDQVLGAMSDLSGEMAFIITKANADLGGNVVNMELENFAKKNKHVCLVDSLGAQRYLSALKYAEMVIGNSSSGIIEAPSFKIPTINIGDRQKGRIQAASIINVVPQKEAIVNAVLQARKVKANGGYQTVMNPYGDGKASEKIAEIIQDTFINKKIDLKKHFYDIAFNMEG